MIRKTNFTVKLNDAILALNEQGLTNHDIALNLRRIYGTITSTVKFYYFLHLL